MEKSSRISNEFISKKIEEKFAGKKKGFTFAARFGNGAVIGSSLIALKRVKVRGL